MAHAVRFEEVTKRYPRGWTEGEEPRYASLRHDLTSVGKRLSSRARGRPARETGALALKNVSFEIGEGESFAIIGPNGAGKTTLLRLVAGLLAPGQGSVHVNGLSLKAGAEARAQVGLVSHASMLYGALTVRENVELAALSARRYRRDAVTVDPATLLADAGLSAVADRRAATLDYGSQRRLELARAAALAPAFLLLDEPTSGMSDSESAAMVERVRATAALVGAGVLVIDHEAIAADRVAMQ